jgi:hypothetical protein
MPDLIDISSQTSCEPDGGLAYSYVAPLKYVSAITVTSNVITGITMSQAGEWVRYDYDSDGTSVYAQPGTRDANGRGKTFAQQADIKFGGITTAYITAANAAGLKCPVVAIHVLNNGVRLVQGLEQQAGATGGFVKSKVLEALVIPSMTSGLSTESSNMTFAITSTSRSLSMPTDLTDSEIEAL